MDSKPQTFLSRASFESATNRVELGPARMIRGISCPPSADPATAATCSEFFSGDYFISKGQKNWMHVPLAFRHARQRGSAGGSGDGGSAGSGNRTELLRHQRLSRGHGPREHRGEMLFVYSLQPLKMVWVDAETGTATVAYANSSFPAIHGDGYLSGSSPFIPHFTLEPGELQAFVGIAHSKRAALQDAARGAGSLTAKAGGEGVTINAYRSFFVRLVLRPGWQWSLRVSKPLAFPLKPKGAVSRIQFPTQIADAGDSYVVSLGDMDCTSHAIAYAKGELDSFWREQHLI